MGRGQKVNPFEYDVIRECCLDARNREIYLTGYDDLEYMDDPTEEPGVEYRMASQLIKNLRFLAIQSEDPILIHMKTCGGYWEEGMAIYDAIKACPCYVTILSYTHARSMSSIILQAADWRVMMPHSYFMYHLGEEMYGGTFKQLLSYAEWAKKTKAVMLGIYADRIMQANKGTWAAWGKEKIVNHMSEKMDAKEDVYVSAAAATRYGLADAVFDGDWKGLTEE
jgi:ATP-dependent protease ClpP protease subunit